MTLQTLEEFNNNRNNISNSFVKSISFNGIECPNCKKELVDRTGILLTSNPPKVPIYCMVCDYSGSRNI